MPTREGATYYLTYNEHAWVSDPGEQSDEPYSWQGESQINVYPRALHRSEPSGMHLSIAPGRQPYNVEELSPGAVAYVVIVNYQDGDTFGSSGYWKVAGVFSKPEVAKAIVADCEKERGFDSIEMMRPWDGYFAHVNSVEVVPMVVLA